MTPIPPASASRIQTDAPSGSSRTSTEKSFSGTSGRTDWTATSTAARSVSRKTARSHRCQSSPCCSHKHGREPVHLRSNDRIGPEGGYLLGPPPWSTGTRSRHRPPRRPAPSARTFLAAAGLSVQKAPRF